MARQAQLSDDDPCRKGLICCAGSGYRGDGFRYWLPGREPLYGRAALGRLGSQLQSAWTNCSNRSWDFDRSATVTLSVVRWP